MLLAIDIGNTNVTLGLSKGKEWLNIWRLPTLPEQAPVFYEMKLLNCFFENDYKTNNVDKVVLSSVVPVLADTFKVVLEKIFGYKTLVVNHEIYPKIALDITSPYEIGSDLVANSVAAYERFHSNCIIVDFGTALTFTTLDKKGEILGVAIAPGLKTSITALFSKTAKLPEVPLVLPQSAVGKDTIHAIQAGVLIGYVGLVKHMVGTIKSEFEEPFITIATGGLSSVLEDLHREFDHIEPNLTLDGLRFIGQL